MKTQNISLSANDKITMVSNMHTMLSAGIPILETINSLLEDSKGNQKKLLTALKDDLVQGQHVYYTFSKFPKVFDKVTVNIIKASEEAGTLDATLKDLIATIRKDVEFNDRIKSALIYPVFISVVFFGVMIVILVVVVPKISSVFSRLPVEIPVPTKIMIFVSERLISYPIPITLAAIVLGVAIISVYKKNRILFIRMLISFPLISQLAREMDLTRFTRSLHLLLSAGIPITTALELTQEVVIKKEIQNVIKHTKNIVFSGKRLSQGLKDNRRLIPSIMIKITEAGERSGSLENAMQDISDYLDYQVSNRLKTITALIEPLMLVVVGALIGGMMMAIIAPMYSMISQVGAM